MNITQRRFSRTQAEAIHPVRYATPIEGPLFARSRGASLAVGITMLIATVAVIGSLFYQ